MASLTPYSAIKAQLATLAPGITVVDDEQTENTIAQSDAPFVSLADAFADEETRSIGSPASNWLKETGALEITIFVPSSSSLQAIRSLAETVRDLLRYQVLDESGEKVRVLNVQPPELGEVNDGLWHSMFVICDYEWDYLKATA